MAPRHPSDNPTIEDVDALFTYHPATDDTIPRYDAINEAAKALARVVFTVAPSSGFREQAINLVVLARMMANAAVANSPPELLPSVAKVMTSSLYGSFGPRSFSEIVARVYDDAKKEAEEWFKKKGGRFSGPSLNHVIVSEPGPDRKRTAQVDFDDFMDMVGFIAKVTRDEVGIRAVLRGKHGATLDFLTGMSGEGHPALTRRVKELVADLQDPPNPNPVAVTVIDDLMGLIRGQVAERARVVPHLRALAALLRSHEPGDPNLTAALEAVSEFVDATAYLRPTNQEELPIDVRRALNALVGYAASAMVPTGPLQEHEAEAYRAAATVVRSYFKKPIGPEDPSPPAPETI